MDENRSRLAAAPRPRQTTKAAQLILAWCAENAVSQNALSRRLGYSEGWVNSVVTGRVTILDHARLRRVAEVTGLLFEELASDQRLSAGERLRLGVRLDAVIAAVEAASQAGEGKPLTSERRKELLRDLNRVAEWLQRKPSDIPADPRWLAEAVNRPEIVASSSKRVREKCRSSINVSLQIAGVVHRHSRPISQVRPEWRALYDTAQRFEKGRNISASLQLQRMSPFIRWCDSEGLMPQNVTAETVWQYAEDRIRISLTRRSVSSLARQVLSAWNFLAARLDEWPAALALPARRFLRFAPGELPPAFEAELKAYRKAGGLPAQERFDPSQVGYEAALEAQLAAVRTRSVSESRFVTTRNGKLIRLAEIGDIHRTDKPLAPSTAERHVSILRLAASILLRSGQKAPADIRSIADVATVEAAIACLRDYDSRHGSDKETTSRSHIAQALYRVAVVWCGISEEERQRFAALLKHLRGKPKPGLSEQDRATVNPVLDDKELVVRLLSLPAQTFRELEERRQRGQPIRERDARRMEAAVCLLLVSTLPVRRGTLAHTSLDCLNWPTIPQGRGSVEWPPEVTKTGKGLAAGLAPWKCEFLRTFVQHYRPVLCTADPDSRWLFPAAHRSRPGQPRSSQRIALNLKRYVEEAIGISVRSHLWRKIFGGLIFEATSDDRVVEMLLGQARNSSSTKFYVDNLRSRAAAARLDEILQKALQDGAVSGGMH
ncbi:tyrosine-type recombinase/integrase [Azospirillum halopraeferens]|uniref:tyrosine-type recombinase/integrase n=1 Tax=Azospirillum halopraeferens TaxID=34010 RepID=UPI00040FF266|nr:tyrosine-type recombinase/integrase [Azospirillum halopraeferens]